MSAFACAGPQPVQLQLPPAARIGILNLLEPQMTHVAVGSLRFDSFTRVYPVDWELPGYLNLAIENDLRTRGSYTFIPLAAAAPSDWKQSMAGGVLNAINARMPGDLRAFLERSAEERRLDMVIAVISYDSDSWQKNACFKIGKDPVFTKGYGLFTRSRVLSGLSNLVPVDQGTVAPYANIMVAIFQPQPAALSAFGQAPCSKAHLPDFPWAGGLQFLSPGVIQQLKPYVERLGTEAARNALKAANLLP